MSGSQHGCGIKDTRQLAGRMQVKFWHEFMPESEELLNLLEKVGLLLLNGSLLYQSLVCILDIEDDELPCYCFKIMLTLILSYSLLCFLQLKSSDDKCPRTCIIEICYDAFLLKMLMLLLGQLVLYFHKCNLYNWLKNKQSTLEYDTLM